MRDAKKPRADGFPRPHIGGPACQNEESRLKRVFRVLLVPEDSSASREHQPRVPADQQSEGRLVTREERVEKRAAACGERIG